MSKEGTIYYKRDEYGRQSAGSRGYVSAETMIAVIRQLNLGQAETFVDSELSRLNTEIRAILSLGGVVSQSGHVLEIGLDDAPVNQDFKSKLIEQGIVVDTAAFANKVLDRNLYLETSTAYQQRVAFYAPQLDHRLSFWTTSGNGISFNIDGSKIVYDHYLTPLIKHVSLSLTDVSYPEPTLIPAGAFITQVVCDVCLEIGQGRTEWHRR